MLKQFELSSNQVVPEDWYLELPPDEITIHNLKTGRQVHDLTLIAVSRSKSELLAVGREALRYQNDPETAVFSPLHRGLIAHFPAAQALVKALMKQIGLDPVLIPKPVMCVHMQEHSTQVEQQALGELAIISGARKVFFYTDSLPVMLDCARERRDLNHAILIHIDPQE